MRLDAVSVGRDPPNEVNVVVEVPVGGEPIKYEMDKASGALIVDRFLYTAMRYPGNYGFIPHTLSDDGDPCDVLITNQRGIIPGAVLAVRPVGVLKMQDEAGGDEKIIAVDCKMNLDDNSLMRHPDLEALRDISEEDPTEVEAGRYKLNFVKLDEAQMQALGQRAIPAGSRPAHRHALDARPGALSDPDKSRGRSGLTRRPASRRRSSAGRRSSAR